MEVVVNCNCGQDLLIRQSYSRLGEIVIKVDACCRCTKQAQESGESMAYAEGASDGIAQCQDDINDLREDMKSLKEEIKNKK
jgi:hypothetical protein